MKRILKWVKKNWMWFALGAMMFYLAHPKGAAASLMTLIP
jgi:hypothetical protein